MIVHHNLSGEFPEFKEKIHSLKTVDEHFRRLFEEYSEVSLAVHRSEQRIDLLAEEAEEQLRIRRLRLKDELYARLK
jgi:uncharacterized protein YdcH (DUF465 family)